MLFVPVSEMGKKRIIQKGAEETARQEHAGVPLSEVKDGAKILRGVAHILATYNNTMITVTDERGGALVWSSAGALGFSGAKKATPFAAARVAESVSQKLQKSGLKELKVRVSGVGSGRDSAVRALANQGFHILSIKDVTPLPHNGPRPKKVRRV